MFAPAHIAVSPVSSHFTYDNNGNVTNNDNTTYTWDYQNRLIQTGGTATSTYAYDHTGARVKLTEGGTTTYFPNTLYNVSGTNTTKHIFAHGSVIATVEKNGGVHVLRYVTTDHLNGVNIVTDPSGNIVETLDYYPYGTIRTDTKVGSYIGEKRKFIGQEYDAGTSLSYLNARYYNGATAKFLSQDPVFWEIGQTKDGKTVLTNPQAQNSYAYANNNPVTLSDPNGRSASGAPMSPLGVALMILFSPIQGSYDPVYEPQQYAAQNDSKNKAMEMAMGWVTSSAGGGSNTVSTIAKNRIAGAAFERQVGEQYGMIKNTERIPSISGTAKYRVPDFMDNSKIIESKNVQYQRATNQIKDTARYAQSVGKPYTIVTRQYTQISNQLREISKQLNIIIKNIGNEKP